MKYNTNSHHRRSIRYKGYDYSQPGAYFITLITFGHQNIFGVVTGDDMRVNHLGKIVRSTWLHLPQFFPIRHDEWVIMPNHLHGIICIADNPRKGEAFGMGDSEDSVVSLPNASPLQSPIGTLHGSLGAIIQNFKSVSTRKINQFLRNARKAEALGVVDSEDSELTLPYASPLRVWQRNYFERVVRNEKELDRIRQYIIDNPRKWKEDVEYDA